MCSVSVDTDCNKRGQTSHSIVGAEIQTSCNTEASLLDHCYLLHCVHCLFNSDDYLEIPYRARVSHDTCSYVTVSCNLDLLLHEDFFHLSSSSASTARPCSATESNKSPRHSEIQEGSVHCTVAGIHVGRLLSTIIIGKFGRSF